MDKFFEQEYKDTVMKSESKVSKKEFALDRHKISQMAEKLTLKKYGFANKSTKQA